METISRFRFQSFGQLRRIKTCLQFPVGCIDIGHRYKSTAEQIISISLSRLAFLARWTDLCERFPGIFVQRIFLVSRVYHSKVGILAFK